ncbi:MAG: hypothetical protein HQL46_02190 [Gammaproteobacteria bacterium]|nr:hypothetical protein [Gammaproteobacteria bacterium]
MTKCDKFVIAELAEILARFQLNVKQVEINHEIPGSFWGESEAGLIGQTLYVSEDTPLHSALHEACHYICMDQQRRNKLHTDAAGDYDEENAVCYLQILLSDHFSMSSKAQLMQEMDEWGYTFRLGTAKNWFEKDAIDAQIWLIKDQVIDNNDQILWQLRHN